MKTRKELISYVRNNTYEGQWQSFGAGETGCDLICNGRIVGELTGDNGTNKAYNPSGESWQQSIEDLSYKYLLQISKSVSEALKSEPEIMPEPVWSEIIEEEE